MWTQLVPVMPVKMLVSGAFKVLLMPRGNIYRFILQLECHKQIFSGFFKPSNRAVSTATQLAVSGTGKASVPQGGTPEHSLGHFKHDWGYPLGYFRRVAPRSCGNLPWWSPWVHMLVLLHLHGKLCVSGTGSLQSRFQSLVVLISLVFFQIFIHLIPCKIFQKALSL